MPQQTREASLRYHRLREVNLARAVNFVNLYDSEDGNGVALSASSDSMH
jgi:hypothetical protein